MMKWSSPEEHVRWGLNDEKLWNTYINLDAQTKIRFLVDMSILEIWYSAEALNRISHLKYSDIFYQAIGIMAHKYGLLCEQDYSSADIVLAMIDNNCNIDTEEYKTVSEWFDNMM